MYVRQLNLSAASAKRMSSLCPACGATSYSKKRTGCASSSRLATDQFDREKLKRRGIRLASAQGVNVRAVSEHAMALILAITRRLPEARDNQAKHVWRGMISDLTQREDELGGKTLLIIGLGG